MFDVGDEIYHGPTDSMVVIEDIADGYFLVHGRWIPDDQFEAFAPADENIINVGDEGPDLADEKREVSHIPHYQEDILDSHRFCSGSLAAIRYKRKVRMQEWGRLR